jgi:U3 small nucleolar RNA-associated protein 22
MDIIIEFEKSSRWPDDLKAIQTIKLAFFECLASALMKSLDGLKPNVVVGDGVHTSDVLDKACLEIITPDGWAFSAHICHDREVHLLDRTISGTGNLPRQTDTSSISSQFCPMGYCRVYFSICDSTSTFLILGEI